MKSSEPTRPGLQFLLRELFHSSEGEIEVLRQLSGLSSGVIFASSAFARARRALSAVVGGAAGLAAAGACLAAWAPPTDRKRARMQSSVALDLNLSRLIAADPRPGEKVYSTGH